MIEKAFKKSEIVIFAWEFTIKVNIVKNVTSPKNTKKKMLSNENIAFRLGNMHKNVHWAPHRFQEKISETNVSKKVPKTAHLKNIRFS